MCDLDLAPAARTREQRATLLVLLPVIAMIALFLLAITLDLTTMHLATRRANDAAQSVASSIAGQASAAYSSGSEAVVIDQAAIALVAQRRLEIVDAEPWLRQSAVGQPQVVNGQVTVQLSGTPPLVFFPWMPAGLRTVHGIGHADLVGS